MARYCKFCGRHLRTGVKYCYACKSLAKNPANKIKRLSLSDSSIIETMILTFIAVLFFSFKIYILGALFIIIMILNAVHKTKLMDKVRIEKQKNEMGLKK